jgi:engulfment/cell motility protein 1
METIDKLQLRDEKTLRLSLFNLQKCIKEEQFATEFLARGGLHELCQVIISVGGNTLAYALTALSNLLDLPYGWETLSLGFIYKIVQILASPNNLVNVCRPATLILKKLVEADGSLAANMAGSSQMGGGAASSAGKAAREKFQEAQPGSVYRFGFDVVYEQMRHERNLLEIVVGRLGGGESMMVLYRCAELICKAVTDVDALSSPA